MIPLSSRLRPYLRAPVLGAAFGVFLVIAPVLFGAQAILILFSLAGLIIVVGGVIAVAFMSFEGANVKAALRAIMHMFNQQPLSHDVLRDDMTSILKWSRVIKERGARSFESRVGPDDIEDPFVKYGLNMVLSDYTTEEVRGMLETAANASYERDSIPVDILHAMASHAPAFGMVGTLVGMVAMLSHLNADIAVVGQHMAVAFLCTLYGVISARMVYIPAAERLHKEVENRRFRCHLITEGLAMLAGKNSQTYIQDKLNSFLRPEIHNYFDCFTAGQTKKTEALRFPALTKPVHA
jgi:chemotaxis protein MotA